MKLGGLGPGSLGIGSLLISCQESTLKRHLQTRFQEARQLRLDLPKKKCPRNLLLTGSSVPQSLKPQTPNEQKRGRVGQC